MSLPYHATGPGVEAGPDSFGDAHILVLVLFHSVLICLLNEPTYFSVMFWKKGWTDVQSLILQGQGVRSMDLHFR